MTDKTDAQRIAEVREVMAAVMSAVGDNDKYETIRPGRFRSRINGTEVETNYVNGEAKFTFFGYQEREPAAWVVVREKNLDVIKSLSALIPGAMRHLVEF